MPGIASVLTRATERAPDHVAVHEWQSGRQITYRQLDRWASAIAARLRGAGLARGARVAIHLPNGASFLAAQFGALRAGMVASFVNYRLLPAEALRQMSMAKVRCVVTTSAKAPEFAAAPALAGPLMLLADADRAQADSLLGLLDAPEHAECAESKGIEEEDAIARFTSGSTGVPKGVLVSHRAWLIRAVSILAEELKVATGSTTLVLGPLSHQAGLYVLPTFMRQGTMVTLDPFDLDAAAAALRGRAIDQMQMVPTMLRMILDHAGVRDALAASAVRQIVYGGSPIAETVMTEALDLLPECDFVQGYGSHEAGAISHLDGPAHRDPRYRRSAGRPFLAAELRVAPATGGSDFGEIEVRAPWTPRARITDEGRVPVAEEWIGTGDLGEIRDGFVFLMDRAHDLIISGGFNVYPSEVEGVLNAHPAVAVSAVVSMPDDKWGEKVIAYVVAQPGRQADPDALQAFCKSRLSGYKVPKEIHAIAELPLNANGKPDRRKLSEPHWAGRERRIN